LATSIVEEEINLKIEEKILLIIEDLQNDVTS
jgi:hypothetical protein